MRDPARRRHRARCPAPPARRPGFGASTLRMRSAFSASSRCPRSCRRAIARARRRSVKLPPSGKITNASSPSRPEASTPICSSRPLIARADEPVRQPVQQDVDRRVPLQRVLEHDARLPVVLVDEGVHEQERVARPGVPAEHQEWPVVVRRWSRAVDLDPQVQHSLRLAEHDREVALDQAVVRPLERRCTGRSGRTSARPTGRTAAPARRSQGPGGPAPSRAPATAASRPGRNGDDQRGDEQPDRQTHDRQHGEPDHRRGEHHPAEPARRQHVSPASRRGRPRSRGRRGRSGCATAPTSRARAVVGAPLLAAREDMDAYAGRHGGHVPGEPVPAGDLERHGRHLPRSASAPRGGRSTRPTWST